MNETDYIKRKIEYLKYTTTTFFGLFIVMLWKTLSQPYILTDLGTAIRNGVLIVIAFLFFVIAVAGNILWHNEVEKLK